MGNGRNYTSFKNMFYNKFKKYLIVIISINKESFIKYKFCL